MGYAGKRVLAEPPEPFRRYDAVHAARLVPMP